MRAKLARAAGLTALAAATAFWVLPAEAKCQRMGFLVNDYGKDGPARDAQDLLDKHVAEWAAKNGITNYKIGKKDVTCELFLNFILFDEHTCTASANVCWDEGTGGGSDKTAKTGKSPEAKPEDKKPSKSSEKTAPEAKPGEAKAAAEAKPDGEKAAADASASDKKDGAASEPVAGAAAATAGDAPKADETPSSAKAAEAAKPEASAVETGALPGDTANPAEDDAAAKAAAAAERAAAAAERAAAAAERAAEAASAQRATATSSSDQLQLPAFGAPREPAADVPPVTPKSP